MIIQSTKKRNAEILRKEAEQLLGEHRENIRKQAEVMLSKSGRDLARMSSADIEKLLFELQVHQIELEMQNEELKRTHQELSASRDDFARIYNLSPVAYLSLNEQGIIRKANIAAAQLLGGSKEGLVNKKLGKFIHPSDQDKYYFYLQDLVMEKKNQILNAKLEAKNSATIHSVCQGFTLLGCTRSLCMHNNKFTYVELRGAVNKNYKNGMQICLAIQDVTEYKYAQETNACLNEKLEQKILEQTSALMERNLDLTKKVEELKHSKRQLREREIKLNAIFNASIEGIITINSSGIILSTNSAVETIFGYSEKELIGCRFNKLMSPSQSKNQGNDLKSYLQAKAPSVIGQIREVEGMHKDGSMIPLDMTLVEFSIDGANYFTGIVRDVSLRKHQEQQEKKHLEELAHVTRLCLIGEMGSGIAHEVNQPLTAIANYTQACLRFIGADKPDVDQLGEILFKIHQQALKAGQIIHRMKDFVSSRKIYRTDTDINFLVEDAVSLCATDFKQNNISLELDLARNLPNVTIDNVQIEQVLLNLIRNSIDALMGLPQKTQRQIQIQTHMKSFNQIEIKVHDNGSGINEAQKEKILTPFFTTKPTGMGMGLSISRSIIEAHEGVLYFNSEPEKGTTFYFTLPVKRKIK
ncbi:MAG: Signal transduction histidine kinase, nitrogen specific, NtrB [Methylococcaceae bacterium NSP1-1]|nr:MAG: Signal transduction histidine kinase, nitrogen specific, NtrB [Methylococcaceae bacterium NSP1-1]